MFKPLGSLFIMNIYEGLGYLLKLSAYERNSYFWKKLTLVFTFNFLSLNYEEFIYLFILFSVCKTRIFSGKSFQSENWFYNSIFENF